MDLIEILDEEIRLSKKSSRPVNVRLSHVGNGVYKGVLPFKIEGDYILNSKNIENQPVVVECQDNTVIMEVNSKEEQINAFLSKDETLLLEALKKQIRGEMKEEPSFIIGPPGTGKTKVIVKIIEEAIKNQLKVLVVSPTNMAVENVFERLNTDSIEEGEVILTIKTNLEQLQQYSVESIKQKKLTPLEDELDVLQMAKEDMVRRRKDLQPDFNATLSKKDAIATKIANMKREIANKVAKKHSLDSQLKECTMRIEQLTGNMFLESVAKIFMSEKLKELSSKQNELNEKVSSIEAEIKSLQDEMMLLDIQQKSTTKQYNNAQEKLIEVEASLAKIKQRIKSVEKKIEDVKSENFFEGASVVGATLINASLGQKIQNAEFDMIIVDEASMALYPSLVVVAQALNNKKRKELSYEEDEELYEAQNRAVEMALGSKFVCVGDPKQLSPIAKTHELRKDVFAYYGADSIFEGENPENTVLLDRNFRNHPHITALASKMFYGGLLKSGKEDDGRDSLFVRRSTSKMVHSEGSYVNYGNMKIVVSQVKRALERGRRSIGVITPYKKQALLIEENIASLLEIYPDADIQCGTIHIFQGKEKEIIIYDITYSPDGNKVPASYNGDLKSNTACLLNVAMTRAEDFFIVVGDIEGICSLDSKLAITQWVSAIQSADK